MQRGIGMTTKNEDEWLRKFYNGTFLVKGWRHHMEEMLKSVPSDKKEQIGCLLDDLGRKIGTEWAKDNNIRKIDTSMLKQWGDDLRAHADKGPDSLVAKIRLINDDVDNILGVT